MIWLLSRRNMPTIIHKDRQKIYQLDPRSAWWGLFVRCGATLPVDMLIGGGGGSVRLLMLAQYFETASPILKYLKIVPDKLKAYTTALLADPVHAEGLKAQLLASGCVGVDATEKSAVATLQQLAASTTDMARRVHSSIEQMRKQRLLREDILAHACKAWKCVMSARAACADFFRLFGRESDAQALSESRRRICNHFAPDIYPWAHPLSFCHGHPGGYAVLDSQDVYNREETDEQAWRIFCEGHRRELLKNLSPPLQNYVMRVLKESRMAGRRGVVHFVPTTVTDASSFESMLRAWDNDVVPFVWLGANAVGNAMG